MWMNIKDKVCGNDLYKREAWYSKLHNEKKELIEMLKDIQKKEGLSKSIKAQDNPQMDKLIETRVDLLFPETNFYFFRKLKNSEDPKMVKERDQLR